MKTISVRNAKKTDAFRVWEIRNDPKARQNSLNTDEIPYPNHLAWFENKYRENSGNYCFVADYDDQVVGYCRLDASDDRAYRASIAIDADYRGKGLGYLLLKKSIEKMATGTKISAEIKKDNGTSIRIFEKNGFNLIKEDEENLYYEKK